MSIINDLLYENFNLAKKVRGNRSSINQLNLDSFDRVQGPENEMIVRLFLTLIITIFLIIFLSRLIYLQIVKGESYQLMAQSNLYREIPIYANRGVIKDVKGKIYVRNRPGYQIKIDNRAYVGQEFESRVQIAKVLGADESTLYETLKSNIENGIFYTVFSVDVEREKALNLIAQTNTSNVIFVESVPIRDNLYPLQTAHITGYLGRIDEGESVMYPNFFNEEQIGKLGIEKKYEVGLHGESGLERVELTASGKTTDKKVITNAVDGKELITNINLDLQLKAYELVKKSVEDNNGLGGALIAINPKNGRILSFVSYPSYDVNKFSSRISEKDFQELLNDEGRPLNNKIIAGLYPPGSTFKIISATGIVEENIIDPEKTIDGGASVSLGSTVFRDWNPAGHGPTNLYKALASSVDTYFYKTVGGVGEVDKGLGVANLAKWATNFGLGEKTGIDISGEVNGVVPTEAWKKEVIGEDWYDGNTLHYSIGQGYLLSTPIQVAMYTTAIANNGLIFEPRLVGENDIPKDIGAKPTTIEIVKQGLKQACEAPNGTGYPFIYPKYQVTVGCKTGTSEFGEKNKLGKYQTHAWFTVFAPYDDPEIVVTVLIEAGGEGGTASAPVAKKYLDSYFGFDK
ncbi:MAG: penicillin-binding protein 2 [bacterium]|nr:penicillin-binding protein 2 [bacterium]